MQDFPSDLLLRHPGLAQAWGVGIFICLASTIGGIVWLVRQWRQQALRWNCLLPLPIPIPALLLFLGLLFFLIAQLGGVFLHSLILAGALLMFRIYHLPLEIHLGLNRYRWTATILRAGILAAAAYLPLLLLSTGVSAACERLGIPTSPQPAVALFLQAKDNRTLAALLFLAVVAAPVCEEFFFRGFLQPILKHHLSSGGALLLTAFVFAALHEHGPTLLPLFALGCLLGAVYETSGSFPLCVGLHAGFNGLTALGLLTTRFFN